MSVSSKPDAFIKIAFPKKFLCSTVYQTDRSFIFKGQAITREKLWEKRYDGDNTTSINRGCMECGFPYKPYETR